MRVLVGLAQWQTVQCGCPQSVRANCPVSNSALRASTQSQLTGLTATSPNPVQNTAGWRQFVEPLVAVGPAATARPLCRRAPQGTHKVDTDGADIALRVGIILGAGVSCRWQASPIVASQTKKRVCRRETATEEGLCF